MRFSGGEAWPLFSFSHHIFLAFSQSHSPLCSFLHTRNLRHDKLKISSSELREHPFEIAYNEDSHLKITHLGTDVLYGRKQADLAVIVREDQRVTKKRKETAPIIDLTPAIPGKEDKALFEALRTLRWEIAKEESRAPYLIMGDKTLHELATTKPTNLLAFGNTFGIGQHKCETYGERFLAVIKDYPTTAAAPTDEEEQATIPPEEVIFDLVDPQPAPMEILPEEDTELFESLRQMRLELAHEIKKPAFWVMSDKTLHELTRQAPTTLEAFAEVKGIGPQKTEQYGELFVTLINNYIQERHK